MSQPEQKQRLLAKLRNARNELEDCVLLSVPAARYDPPIIPKGIRNELSAMISGLDRVLRDLEGAQ